jgi:purine-binding chemotaxis protein CheW
MTTTAMNGAVTYLTFTLAGELFAVNVANVREILEMPSITRVPGSPEFMRGVINLRGSVVPVVDMRLKFGIPVANDTVSTCVIVLEVAMEGEPTVIGAIADSVNEVFEIDDSQIEPPPKIGTNLRTDLITGMGRHGDRFIIILDTDRVFSEGMLTIGEESSAEPPAVEERAEADRPGAPRSPSAKARRGRG